MRPVDLAVVINYLALDIITDLAYGKPFGYIAEDKDLFNFMSELSLGGRIGLGIAHFPWLANLMKTPLVTAIIGTAPPGIAKMMELVVLLDGRKSAS